MNSFSELVLGYVAQKDYCIQITDRGADVTLAAVHGGLIEPLTSELVHAIAGSEHNIYELKGLIDGANTVMRIPSARFSEMRLNALVRRSLVCVAVDGVPGSQELIHLGGKNTRLKAILAEQLAQSGFTVATSYSLGAAHDPTRYYNVAKDGGVLLELSEAMRMSMVSVPLTGTDWQQPAVWLSSFFQFATTVNSALYSYLEYIQSDLSQAMQRFEEATYQMPRALRSGHHHRQEE
ncbi:MAG: poly-gamma-glutamate hydrolase family protein [Chloroflexi bacterium]|nr:poly-gamma-glutamate hydrolase family protein [Chloroflexota bacterium]